jgi:HD-GYP domain-containing protein (c-di-GMP phosphodiesterase class II)
MKCPGQDSRYWKPGAIFEVSCPQCGDMVEFFKDDTMRRCPGCGHRFVNPHMDFGCAAYCRFAEQCIGSMPPELLAQRDELLKDRIGVEMKRYYGRDFRRIAHATRVARHAETIAAGEGGDMGVIMAAAYLHDVGIQEDEKESPACGGRSAETEGPSAARRILEGLGAAEGLIEEVCEIIGRRGRLPDEESRNAGAVHDADLIAGIEERQKKGPLPAREAEQILETGFYTETGRRIARKVLLGDSG